MSQDNQNSQPPSSPESQGNQSKSTVKPPQASSPVWKSTIIQLLRGTIGVLETAVVKLETEPLADAKQTPSFFQQLQSRWSGLLRTIRLFLPSNLSTKLSDTALTGIVGAIAVVVVWTTSSILTNKPAEVATVPPVEEISTPTPTVTIPPPPVAPSEPPPSVEITPPQVTPTELSPSVEITPPPVAPTEPPPEAQTFPPPTPQPEATPTPTPTPTPELTPEQALIVAIENQVAEISDRLASGLIQSIQANFRSSNLTVKISGDWYTLKKSQQDKLAGDILQRSQELDFTHLEIIDPQNRLVARNPVVGTEMVIFRRE